MPWSSQGVGGGGPGGPQPPNLEELLRRGQAGVRRILPGGEIDDHASPALAEIRTAITKTEEKLHRSLRRLLRRCLEKDGNRRLW